MKKINDRLTVAPQLTGAAIEQASRDGVRMIVNNRPDGEEPGQPSAAEQAAIARANGMDYAHIPVTVPGMTEAHVRDFQAALGRADGPVLAHCKSGTRSLLLWTIGEVLDGRMSRSEIDGLSQRTGIDLAAAKKWLDANR